MYEGGIISISSSSKEKITEMANKLGKLHENTKFKIYYRKKGEYIRSILASLDYPDKFLDSAELISLSSFSILYLPENLSWQDGELAMLIDSLNIQNKIVISNLEGGKLNSILSPLNSFKNFKLINDISDLEEFKEKDLGIVYIDRVFTVKGVGTVVTGFSYTKVEVHDKLIALPYNKEVEIKSIQVLDEDVNSVGSGVRVGFALRNVKEDEIKDLMYLIKPNVKVDNKIEGKLTKYPWSTFNEGQNHVLIKGYAVPANVKVNNEKAEIKTSLAIPIINDQIPILNVNVKQGKPRVIGYVNL